MTADEKRERWERMRRRGIISERELKWNQELLDAELAELKE